MRNTDRATEVARYGIKARGKKETLKHLTGKRLSPLQAIYAKCFECMGYYSDGKMDCQVPSCPLYPFMPYQEGSRRLVKSVSEETREAMKKRMAKVRAEKQVKVG